MVPRTILHCDCNNFYASVEQLYHPALRGRPLAVAGDPEQRHGIVLAKNELAKRCGVRTGHPLWLARQLCPDLLFVPPHYAQYSRFSRLCREIYRGYTDQVESFGLDECWLDVTGSLSLFGEGRGIADQLRRTIREELGITISVGVSFNKVFAKLGSDLKKPDATTVIEEKSWRETVWPLPAADMLGVGPATDRLLKRYGIRTIGQLAQAPSQTLHSLLGKNGDLLWSCANGLESSSVSRFGEAPPVKSIGNSTTMPRDLEDGDALRLILYILAESVAERLREQDLQCRTVQVSFRSSDLSWMERQAGLDPPSCSSQTLFEASYRLYKEHGTGRALRSIGLRACGLQHWAAPQTTLLKEAQHSHNRDAAERAVDQIRRRFGRNAIRRGIMLTDEALSALDPRTDHPERIAGSVS